MSTEQEIEARSQSLRIAQCPAVRLIRIQIWILVCHLSVSPSKFQGSLSFSLEHCWRCSSTASSVWTTKKFPPCFVFSSPFFPFFFHFKSDFLKQFYNLFVWFLYGTLPSVYLLFYYTAYVSFTPTVSNSTAFLALIYWTSISTFPFFFNFLIQKSHFKILFGSEMEASCTCWLADAFL